MLLLLLLPLLWGGQLLGVVVQCMVGMAGCIRCVVVVVVGAILLLLVTACSPA